MKRATLKQSGGYVEIEEKEIPDPPPKGVVVKTKYCGICHSDVLWLSNAKDKKENPNAEFRVTFPFTMGHEISGEVYKIGDKADTDLEVGDEVLVYPWIGCGDCDFCNNDRTQSCKGPGNEVGWNHSGGFGSHVVVADSKFAVKLPPSVPMDGGCLLPCSGLTTFSAVSKIKSHFEGKEGIQHLLLIGAGGLGLICLQLAKVILPKNTRIISADIEKSKLDTALQHGADDVIWWDLSKTPNPTPEVDDDFVRQMKEKSDGGFHGIIDFVNSTSTVSRSFKGLRVGGAITLVGLFGGDVTINLRTFVRLQPSVYGVKVGAFSEFLRLLELVSKNPIKYPPITHYKLEELKDVLDKLHRRKIVGRGVLKYC